jgi:SAM-dependent methyltransferase
VAAARAAVAGYYMRALRRHGPTPAGVDWPSAVGQDLRFAMLLRLCDFAAPFTLNDVGCGYGALLDYTQRRHPTARMDYLGIDVCPAMVACAARQWQGHPGVRFAETDEAPRVADYAIASGIFNVIPSGAAGCWSDLVAATLSDLHRDTRRGFAVNFMGADPSRSREPGLYRTLPAPWIAYCEQAFGAAVTLTEGYALNEFTLLVRRTKRAGWPAGT